MKIIDNYIGVLKNYTKFDGRASRSEYWYFVLANVIISIVLMVIGFAINSDILSNLYSLVTLVPAIAVAVRRMHDVNKSGWFILIPIYNLILACTKGTAGPNDYDTVVTEKVVTKPAESTHDAK
jgi:uncharacterized membrane protein YhaH (DUF805 family)